MILKSEGIVLRTLKHQDSNLIATLYTKEYGIRSFIIKSYMGGFGPWSCRWQEVGTGWYSGGYWGGKRG